MYDPPLTLTRLPFPPFCKETHHLAERIPNYATGSVKVNVLPSPSFDTTDIFPP